MLKFITQASYFIGLIISLWLGLFVVSRNPRRLIAWLTGLTMWSVSGLFLNVMLALNPPPPPAYFPNWLRIFLPFWSEDVLSGPSNGWLQGWSVSFAIAFWHHVTTLMRPGTLDPWRWARILAAYVLAVIAIVVQAFTPFMYESVQGDPLYLNTLRAGPLYLFFMVGLLSYTIFSLINLVRSARATPLIMPRRQLYTLALATTIAGVTGPVGIASSYLGFPVPMFILALLLTTALVLIGYGVANYSALMEAGRTIRRDFHYNAIAIGIITLFYSGVAWASVEVFQVSGTIFLPIILLAVATHTLVDFGRRTLDAVLFQQRTRELRANLRELFSQTGGQEAFEDSISLSLDTLCSSVKAIYGLILLFRKRDLALAATYRWQDSELPIQKGDLIADDVLLTELGHFPPPLEEIALLIPLYAETDQFGAILMGHPENGVQFSTGEVELLLYPSDQLADSIHYAQSARHQLEQVASLLEESKGKATEGLTPVSVKQVEDALRNLYDYAHLGTHPLTKMKLVRKQLPSGTITHLDRGKAVYGVLTDAIQKLRPEDEPGRDPPSREWHPFLVLHEAYVNDVPNRDIMSRLYISEGTFNRTRRAALRAVTRALGELEASS